MVSRRRTSHRLFAAALAGGAALLAAACGGAGDEEEAATVEGPAEPVEDAASAETARPRPISTATRALPGTLPWALGGLWRSDEERARDRALHREEVAEFAGFNVAQSVLELYPGAGEWTAVFAPSLAARGGRYVAAVMADDPGAEAEALREAYLERFADPELFGRIEIVEFGATSGALAPPDSIDVAFTVDDVATWMAMGVAEKAFADIHAALAPGGRLTVVQPRVRALGPQDPVAGSGYVQQAYVVRLAEEAGFTLEESSEFLANRADRGDSPFGVWTLAPYRLTAPLGEPPDPTFDRSVYDAIGEPDRMVLLFRKSGAGGEPIRAVDR